MPGRLFSHIQIPIGPSLYPSLPSYGCLFANISYITTAKEYTSAAVDGVSPRRTSGADQNGDPTFSLLLERPKSATLARKLSSISKFVGLISRCMIGGVETCRYRSPDAISYSKRDSFYQNGMKYM